MGVNKPSLNDLKKLVITRVSIFILTFAALLFLPAGNLAYWEAWMYLATILIPAIFVFDYLLKNNPELLERRMRLREKEPQQKWVIFFSYLYLLVSFTFPGFDKRFGWSQFPFWVSIIADLIVLLGYGMFVLVLKENSYLSRIIEVDKEQTVISTGPYAVVRHPMYVGVILMYTFSPLTLGSVWGMIPAVFIVPILIGRILNEEAVLMKGLKGYTEYMQKVRYRILPGVW